MESKSQKSSNSYMIATEELKPGARQSTLISHMGDTGPRNWTIFYSLSTGNSRELDWKGSS